MHKKLISFGIFLVMALQVFSSTSLANPNEALTQTQDFLKDRKQVEAFAAKDPNAKRANDAVDQAVGTGVEKDQLLKLTSEIMAVLVKKHNGDIQAMQADLLKAMSDPKKFIESLPPEHRAQVRSIATEVEKKNRPVTREKP